MIEIKDKKDCCGCHACATVCAKHCITMRSDEEGFLYPVVNKDTCTDCGLCEKVCPVINQSEPRKPLKVYAAKNKNEEIRRQSSSGGIFTLLAEKVIAEGGVVFGARFDENWDVIHSWTDTIEGIAAFRGSKYVQSTIGDTYREARDFLKQGRKVLFSGTPCQIAGLKKYLRKDYDNLLTVDVVCHGVPSPLVWRTYLNETREQLRAKRGVGKKSVPLSIDELPVITDISFRDKTNGWKKYGFRLRYAAFEAASNTVSASVQRKNNDIVEYHMDNIYMRGFHYSLYLRPSCYACPSKSGKSLSDMTIADYWGIDNYYPTWDDDKGTSLILCYSEFAKSLVKNSIHEMDSIITSYKEGLSGNSSIEESQIADKFINKFWSKFTNSSLKDVVCKVVHMKAHQSLFRRVFRRLKKFYQKSNNYIQ